MLPRLIESIAATREKGGRVVDLFELARPTAAVTAERKEYDQLREDLFRGI